MGEIGGLFFRGDCRYKDRLAYYGAKTGALSLANELHASGKVTFLRGVTDSTTLFGFFNATESVRVNDKQDQAIPSDFLGAAIEGPSGEGFLFYPVYRVHAGVAGEAHSTAPHIYPDGALHQWDLQYAATDAGGELTLSLDGQVVRLSLPKDHLAVGAAFDHFGFVTPWIDGNAQVVYLDDLRYTVAG